MKLQTDTKLVARLAEERKNANWRFRPAGLWPTCMLVRGRRRRSHRRSFFSPAHC